ncbi:hypothetical protein GCM10009530_57350 [Microbispora corallina]|uniref:Uncharacterized protein n=1 Tax=Microbispora corallina TaxID=83302 RepID=A0ABQ4G3S1_9ACTN|nr:permease prefix domain 1-containing protein [Microbispora corallina]GIH41680.1 hypothetical protein Mco01_46800 [Microbispora corallina]
MANAGPIDDYVAALRRGLHGPAAAKRDLVTEARDSLVDAAEAYECEGLPREQAERLAVEDFGPLGDITPGYQQELVVGQGRRTAALLFVSVPLTALMWSVIWKIFPDMPAGTVKPVWFTPVARTVDCTQVLTGVVGGLALLALGRGARRFDSPARVTRWLGLLVWGQMPVMVAMCMAMSVAHGPLDMAQAPATVVTALSYGFWTWQLHSAARCLLYTSRPALTAAGRARFRSRS